MLQVLAVQVHSTSGLATTNRDFGRWETWGILSWYNLISPPLSASTHLHPALPTSIYVHPPLSMSTCPLQLHCTYCWTNFGSRPNMSGPSSHAKGHHTYALFPICPICLIPLHWQ